MKEGFIAEIEEKDKLNFFSFPMTLQARASIFGQVNANDPEFMSSALQIFSESRVHKQGNNTMQCRQQSVSIVIDIAKTLLLSMNASTS